MYIPIKEMLSETGFYFRYLILLRPQQFENVVIKYTFIINIQNQNIYLFIYSTPNGNSKVR